MNVFSLPNLAYCLNVCPPSQVRQSIVKEYDQVKEINQTLANFKKDTVHFGGPRRSHEEEPTRDPDVWPPPTPVERDNRYEI